MEKLKANSKFAEFQWLQKWTGLKGKIVYLEKTLNIKYVFKIKRQLGEGGGGVDMNSKIKRNFSSTLNHGLAQDSAVFVHIV